MQYIYEAEEVPRLPRHENITLTSLLFLLFNLSSAHSARHDTCLRIVITTCIWSRCRTHFVFVFPCETLASLCKHARTYVLWRMHTYNY